MSHNHLTQPPREELYELEEVEIDLSNLNLSRRILDVGGGGEGIISRLAPHLVVCIDIDPEELDNVKSDSIKIIMDSRDLKFFDNTFNIATAFFSLIYMADIDYLKIFSEVYRVLKPGGRFSIWDIVLSKDIPPKKKYIVQNVNVTIDDKEYSVGYGTRIPQTIPRNPDIFEAPAVRAGFKLSSKNIIKNVITITFKKPGRKE